MERKLSDFWKYSFLAIWMVVCAACKSEVDATSDINKYIYNKHGVELKSNIRRVFVVNDQGCGNCIRYFSEYILENINDDNSMVIINSKGHNLDIEGFVTQKQLKANVLISHDIIREEESPFYNSCVIYVNENKIDTIIYIDSENLFTQISYINSHK